MVMGFLRCHQPINFPSRFFDRRFTYMSGNINTLMKLRGFPKMSKRKEIWGRMGCSDHSCCEKVCAKLSRQRAEDKPSKRPRDLSAHSEWQDDWESGRPGARIAGTALRGRQARPSVEAHYLARITGVPLPKRRPTTIARSGQNRHVSELQTIIGVYAMFATSFQIKSFMSRRQDAASKRRTTGRGNKR